MKSQPPASSCEWNLATRPSAFFTHDFAHDLLPANRAIRFQPRIPARNKLVFPLANDSVALEFCTLPEQHDIAHFKLCDTRPLDVKDLAVGNDRQHAAAPGLQAKAKTAREQPRIRLAESLR